jgi:type I restriction enzyme S subunit
MIDSLPEGWGQVRLEDLTADPTSITYGVLKPGPFCADGGPMLRVMDLVNGRVDEAGVYKVSKELADLYRRTRLHGGEVLVSVQGSVGKVAIVPYSLSGANISRTLAVIPPTLPSLAKWIWAVLQTPQIQTQMGEVTGGTTRDSLNLRDLRMLEIPFPPLAEQRRILVKLETLLGKVDVCHIRLSKIPSLLKRFRQSVLTAACSGQLTGDWRKETGTNRTDWRESKLIDLLAEPLSNGRSVVDAATGFPVLRLTCLKNGRIDLTERKIGAWTAETAKRFLIFKEDFFVSRGNGSLSHVGRGGLVEDSPDGVAFPDTLIRVRVRKEIIQPTFLRQMWSGRPIREQIESAAHTTAGIWKISQKDIEKFVLAVPPLPEQQEIVRRVEALFALADQLEARLAKAKAQVDKLTPSLLARAFRGELVPTEARLANQEGRDFESASALLGRIRADRASRGDERPGKPAEAARPTHS